MKIFTRQFLSLFVCLLYSFTVIGQSAYRGLYVDNFDAVLGNTPAEDSLLTYALQNNFTTLTLYKLHNVQQQHDLTQLASAQLVANFINKAKTQFHIQQVTAVGENYHFFSSVISIYNQLHPLATQRFDAYNLEFEFWNSAPTSPGGDYCTSYLIPNGYPCTVQGAYSFYITQLDSINTLAHMDGCLSETYVGWPDSLQSAGMLPHADRILLHAYVTNPGNAFGYTESRLGYFGSTADTAHIIILFSSEPSFLGPWLSSHYQQEMFPLYMGDYNAQSAAWKQHVNLLGYQWFDYTDMQYTWMPNKTQTIVENKELVVTNDNESLYIRGYVTQWPICVQIFDMSGRAVQRSSVARSGNNEAQIYLRLQTSGMYSVIVTDASGAVLKRKLISITR